MENKVEVKWTGEYPCLCYGEWILKVNGKDYSDIIPFKCAPADTYGKYQNWHFENWIEVFDDYVDGLHPKEWINKNDDWLSKITDDDELKRKIFRAFKDQDWRYGECGGCI